MAEDRDDPPSEAPDTPSGGAASRDDERSGAHRIHAVPSAESSIEDAPLLGTADEETFEIDPAIELDALPRGTTIGRYVLLGRIGPGRLGVMYAAFDPERDGKVALRLLPMFTGDSEALQQRLALVAALREVAKVEHPCIVSTYDVGTWSGGVYVAMEFFDGIDLSTWSEARDEPFPWREVVRAFREAGRGLAFAHKRGIVHGDFAPERVLMGKQGQIRVIDFAIAETTVVDGEDEAEAIAELRDALGLPERERDALPATIPGSLDYVAPEVLAGERADAKSDQFSFCVALYEGLFGERPYADGRVGPLASELAQGRVRPAPSGSDVPQWLRAVVMRGLAPHRGDRWPSMELLLRELDRDPAASRRRWIRGSAVLGLAGVIVGLVAYGAIHEERQCETIEQSLAGVWDSDRRATLERGFLATGLPHAADTWRTTADVIEDWVSDASGHRVEACKATRVRGEASEELYAERLACLDARMGELRGLLEVFERIDADVLARAPMAAGRLESVRSCTLPSVLREVAASEDADVDRVHDVSQRLARAWALLHLGRTTSARELADGLDRDAEGLRHPGLETGIVRLQAAVALAEGRGTAAELALHEAARRASREQLDHALARAWLDLGDLLVTRPGRAGEAERWASYAESLVERLPDERAMRIDLAILRGDIAAASDKPADALAHYHDALAQVERHDAPVLDRVAVLDRLARLVVGRGEHDAAEDYANRALELVRGSLGPNHPELAHSLVRLANIQIAHGTGDEASANWNRAVTILGRAHGAQSREVALALVEIGEQQRRHGQNSAALEHERRAVALLDRAGHRDPELLARALVGQGRSLLALGRAALAREPLERAAASLEAAHRTAAQEQADLDRRTRLALAWADAQADLARALWAGADERERARTLARSARALHLEHGGDRSAVADLELVLASPELP